jgi:hypothetical protein
MLASPDITNKWEGEIKKNNLETPWAGTVSVAYGCCNRDKKPGPSTKIPGSGESTGKP